MHTFYHAICLLFLSVNFIYFWYIVFCLVSWIKLSRSDADDKIIHHTKVTVIIPARNEEAIINACLKAVSAQLYPEHLTELIVVDDHSTDNTKEVAEQAFARLNINGKVISNPGQGKKSAITEAIHNSSGELLVLTDADCRSNNKWLSALVSEYEKSGAYMLCGPVHINCNRSFLQRFQSLELCGLSLLSGAGINMGIPLLCNGANIAYTRDVFNKLEGFKGIDNIPTGDDILFMFKVQQKYPGKIRYVKSKDAIVYTWAQKSFPGFISQRIRWASKGLNAKNLLNSFVSIFTFGANFLSLLAILYLIFLHGFHDKKLMILLILGISIKIIADFLLLVFAVSFFRRKRLLWFFLPAEMVTMLYVSYIGMAANMASYNWKGRYYKRKV